MSQDDSQEDLQFSQPSGISFNNVLAESIPGQDPQFDPGRELPDQSNLAANFDAVADSQERASFGNPRKMVESWEIE